MSEKESWFMDFVINKKIVSTIKKYGIYVLIFLVSFFIRLNGINNKTVFGFFDDPYSFISATPTNLSPEKKIAKIQCNHFNFDENKIYTGLQIKETLFRMDSSIKSIAKDISAMRNKSIDRQHPNLYYTIFRVWGAGVDTLNIKKMIRRGCYLNLIFYTLSFFFMYKLLSLIKNDKKFIALGLFFAFICTESISFSLLLRMYSLFEFSFILLNYVFILILNKIIKKEDFTKKQILCYSLAMALFLLSSYFSIPYAVMVVLIIISACIYFNNIKALKKVLIIFSLAIAVVLLIYPSYFDLWTNNEHTERVSGHILNFSFTRLINAINFVCIQLKDFLLYPLILLLTFSIFILHLLFPKNEFFKSPNGIYTNTEISQISLIVILGLLWAIVSIVIAPSMWFRYMAISMSSISLFLPFILCLCNKKLLLYEIAILYLFLSTNAVFVRTQCQYCPQIKYFDEPFDISQSKELFAKNTPVIFKGVYWFHVCYWPYLGHEQPVKFVTNEYDKKYPFDKYIIIQHDITPPQNSILLEQNYKDYAFFVDNR